MCSQRRSRHLLLGSFPCFWNTFRTGGCASEAYLCRCGSSRLHRLGDRDAPGDPFVVVVVEPPTRAGSVRDGPHGVGHLAHNHPVPGSVLFQLGDVHDGVEAAPDGVPHISRPDDVVPPVPQQWRHLVVRIPRHRLRGDHQPRLAADREPWLVIDPKPMSGDPHYEVAPLLRNRWDDIVRSGNVRDAVRRRFHTVVDVAELEEDRARDWVVVREMTNAMWTISDAAGAGRGLDNHDNEWITRCVSIAKAVQT